MGSSSQKWLYKRRPKRLFKNKPLPTGDTLPHYVREFKLRPSKGSANPFFIITLIIVLIVLLSLGIRQLATNAKTHVQETDAMHKSVKEKRNDNAFEVLYSSAYARFFSENYLGAKSEFEKALKLKPNDLNANIYYIQTLITLCEKENSDCDKVLSQVNNALKHHPNNIELLKAKSTYYFNQKDTANAILILEKIYSLD